MLEEIALCFRKAGFVIPSLETDQESFEQLGEKDSLSQNKLPQIHEKIIEAD